MAKKLTYALIFVFAIMAHGFAVAEGSQEQQPVDLVLILSIGCDEILKVDAVAHEPCCNELLAACKEEQIIIVSPSVLYGMLRRKRNGQDGINECLDKIARQYAAYLNCEEDFVVLIPSCNTKGLSALGFNAAQLTLIEPESLMRFSETKWASHLIEIDHFRKLFKADEWQYKAPAKSIYLISHGIDALDETKDFSWSMPLISCLTVWQFVNFLQMLNSINAQFLHIASCYTAGANFFNVERILAGAVEDERCHNLQEPLHFPIIIQGTTDSPVSAIIGNGPGCKNYFALIEQWLQRGKDTLLLSEELSRHIYNLKNIALGPNFPLLKMSGSLPSASIPVQGVAMIKSDGNCVNVRAEDHYLFVYPCGLNRTTIAFDSIEVVPQCISKVIGRACHFIGTLQVPCLDEKSIVPFLQACFLKEVVRNYDDKSCYGVSDKSWFMQSITADDSEHTEIAKGVIVCKGMLKYGIHKALILYQDAHNIFHRVEMPLPYDKAAVRNNTISEQEYAQSAARIFWETKADGQALGYATGNVEQCWHVHESYRNFLQTMGIAVLPIDVHAYVSEDIAHIRNGLLKKQTYLQYVAYIHDEEVLRELVSLSLNMSDVITLCDIETLLSRAIDTEWHDVSLRVACELLKKNNIDAQQAAVNVLRYMVAAGLYIHASRACQDVFNCFDAIAQLPVLNGNQLDLEQAIRNFFVSLITGMVQQKQLQAAELIVDTMVQHEKWYRYGLGLEVCTQLAKPDTYCLAKSAQPRLQWFSEDLKKRLTQAALAVYFEQEHIVDVYMQYMSAC